VGDVGMDYEKFVSILNRYIFQSERKKLLSKLVNNPERFVGLFRPSTPKSKLFQHLLQAREIGFGDAFEKIIAEWLSYYGCQQEEKQIRVGGEVLRFDHYVKSPNGNYLLIEQKIRDDHDSSKARGQWSKNFEPKVRALWERHKDKLIAIFYFVDPTFDKNRKLYEEEASKLRKELCLQSIYVWYGRELFEGLEKLSIGRAKDWDEMLRWLEQWRKDLPDLPDVNWETPEAIAELKEIARHSPTLWEQFAKQESLWKEGYVDILFPTRKGLQVILQVLEQDPRSNFRSAAAALRHRLESE